MPHRKTSPFYSMTLFILLLSPFLALFWGQCQTITRHKRTVYVFGAVKKPGGYVIHHGERVTILKALEISGGLTETANKGHSQIIRYENGSESFIEVNPTEVFLGKASDMELVAGDLLIVPDIRKRYHPYDLYDSPPLYRLLHPVFSASASAR